MAECRNCGKEMGAQATACPNCGTPVVKDGGGIGWGILGFFLPLVGIILCLAWKDTKPKTAKALIIGVIIVVVLGVIGQIMRG